MSVNMLTVRRECLETAIFESNPRPGPTFALTPWKRIVTDCNSDPSLWLERIALRQLRSSGWALLTPDRIIVEEYIGILGSDTVGEVEILDEDEGLLGRGGIDFYSFAATADGGVSIYEIDVWITGCGSLRSSDDTPPRTFLHMRLVGTSVG